MKIVVKERSDVVDEYAPHALSLSETAPVLLNDFLASHADGGVLIISAKPHLGDIMLLFEQHLLDKKHIVLFGMHVCSAEEYSFLQRHNIQYFNMIEMTREGLTETTDAVMAFVRQWPSFHLLFYLDALDTAFGVPYSIPGGFTLREMLYVLQRIKLIKSLSSIELMLERDVAESVIAKIVSEIG